MHQPRPRRRLALATLVLAGLGAVTAAGCVRHSGGTWAFDSAPLPEGWPELTPVGEVQVKTYPEYRAASVTRADAGGRSPMFRSLFRHISTNDIAMTAPVDMTYADGDGGDMTSMAFLYRTTDLGPTGTGDGVRVEDVAPRTYATVGTRGSYSKARFGRGLEQLESWLGAHPEWRADGAPRFLGYNGPFTPWFWRYGEVQLPVVPSAPDESAEPSDS